VQFARAHRREIKMLAQHLLVRPDAVRALSEAWTARVAPMAMPVIERLVASGALRDDVPPVALFRQIASAAIGYVLSAVILRPDLAWDDAREIELIVSLLLDGIAPRVRRQKGPKT
jgi:AcrR family transcriptional regulator